MTQGLDVADDVEAEADSEEDVDSHLDDLEAGAGCTEVWEHLSERRNGSEASD